MAHQIYFGRGFVEAVYMADVRYADRLAVFNALAGSKAAESDIPLLINFLDAVLVEGGDQLDFLTHVVRQPFCGGRRIAMVGLSEEHARSAVLAAAALGRTLQVFKDRDQALEWLAPHME